MFCEPLSQKTPMPRIQDYARLPRYSGKSVMVSADGERTAVSFFNSQRNMEEHWVNLQCDVWLKLMSPDLYCRIHRSHIIYLPLIEDFVADFDSHGGEIILENGKRYRVSRKYLPTFHEATKFRFASPVQQRNYRRKKRKNRGRKTTEPA